ncbi:MAG: hypothetical protein ACJ77K_09450 [Bacteroidia bacterium]
MPNLPGALSKILFSFYEDPQNPGGAGIPYQPAYNPSTFSVSHSTQFDTGEQIPATMQKKVTQLNPRVLTMELFFDGTGASPSSSDPIGKATAIAGLPNLESVEGQIRTFLNLAYKINVKEHVPRYVMVTWGKFKMTGRLASANVTYKMFAPDGSPLRATMSITINESVPDSLWKAENMLLSPDLSKSRVVEEGDTLSLLCHKEYGDASLYTKVAEVNNLKNYRKLKQGMELLFPPIDNLA